MSLHILKCHPDPLGAISWGDTLGGNGPWLPKASLPGASGEGHGSVPLSEQARGQK